MPYKDPEHKRHWEREHREQRNARRRALRLSPEIATTPKPVSDPASTQQPTSGWKDILGLAVGLGIAIAGALSGAALVSDLNSSGGSRVASPTGQH